MALAAALSCCSSCWNFTLSSTSSPSLFFPKTTLLQHGSKVQLPKNKTSCSASKQAGALTQNTAFGKFKNVVNYKEKKKGKEQCRSTASKEFGVLEERGLVNDLDKPQAEANNLRDGPCLDAVVKVYCTHHEPDYSLPWQKQRQYTSTSSAFMIGEGKLLTNAHCVAHDTQVKVKRRGDDRKYVAKVLARGADCDLALLSVDNEEFWKGAQPLRFGKLPHLQDDVTVVGYPLGGDTISVTRGVISRIEVREYDRASADLLSIQIDAAINAGNSGGPAFNDQGECIGVAFQVYKTADSENIGYVIPSAVVSHFLTDFERNGKYTGIPSLGVLVQKLENPAFRSYLKVPPDEGVLVRRVEPTFDAYNVLKEGDVILSCDGVHIGSGGTVPFRSRERIGLCYLIGQKFSGDVVELGIVRDGVSMKVHVAVQPRVHLVSGQLEGGQPSYMVVAGLVFTPLSEALICEEGKDGIGLRLYTQARCSLVRFKGEEIVILTEVLVDEVNSGYEHLGNLQVIKLNGTRIRNMKHLAHLVDSCEGKYLKFEFEFNVLVVFEKTEVASAKYKILKYNGIPSERSVQLWKPYSDSARSDNDAVNEELGLSPVTNWDMRYNGMLWV